MTALKKIFGFLAVLLFAVVLISIWIENEGGDDQKHSLKLTGNHFVVPKVPKKMTFAGEVIFFDNLDVKERLERELVVNNFWHSHTILTMKRANRFMPIIIDVFKKMKVPNDLSYLVLIESGLRNVSSSRGAKGYWQLMEETAKEYGLKINNQIDERYDILKSTIVAAKYLKKAYDKFGSWILAAASYNMGMFGVQRELDRQEVTRYFDLSLNEETARYVFRALAFKLIFTHPEKYGFYLTKEELYPPYQTKNILVDSTVNDLVEWSLKQQITLKIFRKLNPWVRGNELKVQPGDTFYFKVPKNQKQFDRVAG